MNDKLRPQPSGPKPSARPTGSGAASSTKPSTAKSKPQDADAEHFDFLDPPKQPSEIGGLGKYRVLKVLGRGGMGTVFMAEDTMLHRIVALKVILKSIANKAVARDRFLREARATAAIEHDHIVTIYEVNEANGVPYLAMQFLKGMTLEDWLRAGKTLNIPQIMRVGKEIAKALAAAHASQLIHRDIKPSNIWLDAANKGRVKILDFGLARPTNEETHLTQEGMILGTPAYMSPEQARGQAIDARCDLFSLGCVLYRICTGKLPFSGADAMSMLLAITNDEPSPLEPIHAELPPAFKSLVMKLLARKPEERPLSAKDVVQTIQSIERDWVAGMPTIGMRPVGLATQDDKPVEPTVQVGRQDDADPALEESAITELELQATPICEMKVTPITGATSLTTRSRLLFAGLGCAVLSVFSVFCCFAVVVTMDRGQIEIIAGDATAKDFVAKNGITLTSHKKQTNTLKEGKHTLASGGYEIDVAGLDAGLIVEPENFALYRGETKAIRIRFVAPTRPKSLRPELVLVTNDNAKLLQRDWAGYLKRDVNVTTNSGIKMVLVPAGEFMMGLAIDEVKPNIELIRKVDKKAFSDKVLQQIANEAPPHLVRITKPFSMSATEITFSQFKRFVTKAKYKTDAETSGKGGTGIDAAIGRKPEFTFLNPGYNPLNESPVTNVTWKDAEAFCHWLSKQDGCTYRLPTEAEWELACRVGSKSLWCFGNDPKELRLHMHLNFSVKLIAPGMPIMVEKRKANGFGLFEMHGNVAEMCSDGWDPVYYKKSPLDDPQGPKLLPAMPRVIRGGSFADLPHVGWSGFRSSIDPALGHATVGFRIVCEVPLPANDPGP